MILPYWAIAQSCTYAHIADALRGRAAYAVTPESALELSKVLDAIKESQVTGAAVPVG